MRIIGGKYKGRTFKPNKKFNARPTTDIAREGLFNILENKYHFSNKTALDLFSGTGSIGYEFASRGCKHVTFVEKNYQHYRFIQQVVESLKIENAQVFKTDIFRFITKIQQNFDFIFADPPYNFQFFFDIPKTIFESGILAENGLLIIEHPVEINFSEFRNFSDQRKYGKVNFSFFEHKA
jgi:16S rRNA (guanine(966)-N(2))-methyltransferase RsmD